jgi:hypothetical protein
MFFLTIARGVSADPIHVTGVMNITREVGAGDRVNLSGPGFALDARVGHLDGYVGPFTCDPCLPGSIVDAGGILSTTVFGAGTLTLNGVTYPVTESLDSPASLYMSLSGFLLAPNFAGLSTSVTVPFTMHSDVLIAGVQSATIRGGGSATVFFAPYSSFPGDVPQWSTTSVRYDFSDPAPVPEPATLLMVGSGLAAVAYAKRRRRSENTERDQRGTATPTC